MFEKNNESEIPLINKSGNIQQLTANVIKECEYLHSYLNIDNAISKDDLTIMIKEAESIVIDMYNKAKEIETQITSMKVNDIKKDISDMNNKFILLKDHFDKENKKYTDDLLAGKPESKPKGVDSAPKPAAKPSTPA